MNIYHDNDTHYKVRKHSKFKSYLAVIIVSSIISSTATGIVLDRKFTNTINQQLAASQKSNTSSNLETVSTKPSGDTGLSAGSNSINTIAKVAGPSVVGIRMTVGNPQSSRWRSVQGQSQSEGSGVIISNDGYIMTNYHVVEYADSKNNPGISTTLEVFLSDGRQAKATYVGGDSKTDLAVVKIDLKDLKVAVLGDSSTLEVGDLAVAIGNPLGMEFAGSVTSGIISALNRQVTTEDKTLTLIQTDAAINPGNSGGALVNGKGEVIGINTIKISTTGVEGLGFAIPINDARPIIDQLIENGYVKGRPLIGISGSEITSVVAQQYGLQEGIYINSVTQGSGAYNAGIQQGDILISLADKEVKTMKDLDEIKKQYKPGNTVNAVVIRNKETKSLKITFTEDN